jgi:hypothetical protein
VNSGNATSGSINDMQVQVILYCNPNSTTLFADTDFAMQTQLIFDGIDYEWDINNVTYTLTGSSSIGNKNAVLSYA